MTRLYIGLFTDDPDKRGPLTKEVQGDGYARQGVSWPEDETWGTFRKEIKGRWVTPLPPKPGE
jgi:hypothetical protein